MSVTDISRHDASLVGIALPLALGALVGALSPVGMAMALGAGSVPASGTLGYALFYRPPGE
ncbi:hypothetical protein BRD09_00710 [Halobacteriales archaeon SW_10_68_16]|jgi:hypothetical protein|nr:MAG: hypothetical protein BRD09_00710 [Halobacteriales archaeon SW_10_68_16]